MIHTTRGSRSTLLLAVLLLVLVACGAQPPAASPPAATQPASEGSLLAVVKQRGRLLIATDANYRPQSFKNADGSWAGFDIAVGSEIARRLGVEASFLDITFDLVTTGRWNGRWDINVGSMTITPERQQVLLFAGPYYYTPASFAVHTDSTATRLSDLTGKKIGVGTGTTYLAYLQGTLSLDGKQTLAPAVQGITPRVYDTDQLALDDLALGDGVRLDAVLTALPTIQDTIKGGRPIKVLGEPVYYEELGVALDRQSAADARSLQEAIATIIEEMHQDGTLTKLSLQFYGVDLTVKQ